MMTLEDTLLKLFEVEAVKFGNFTLKSGIESPIYFDLRVIVSYPQVLKEVSSLLWQVRDNKSKFDAVCGVPYTALPMATLISVAQDLPMLIRRKEAKDYGTKKMIEGSFKAKDKVLIVEDVVTSGTSVLETAKLLQSHGLQVTEAVVLLDREQGGKENLSKHGITLRSVCGVSQLMEIYLKHGKVDNATAASVLKFIKNNQVQSIVEMGSIKTSWPSYEEKLKTAKHLLTQRLIKIVIEKRSNLCVAADSFQDSKDLIQFVSDIGSTICCLKLHVDILNDWTQDDKAKLRTLAKNLDFLLFEDRKFADIGNTVKQQYKNLAVDWADLVTVHGVAGKGTLEGLKAVAQDTMEPRGALIVAQMSSEGNLITSDYTKKCVELAEEPGSFAIGLISQSRLSQIPEVLHFTPGVNLEQSGDNLGQRYVTPRDAIVERGADIIIVGRGITVAAPEKRADVAEKYRQAAWDAYLDRCSS